MTAIIIALAVLAVIGSATLAAGASRGAEDSPITSTRTVRLARAIAKAEGFYQFGSVPQRLNNPGDLTVDTTGTATGKGGPGNAYVVYRTIQDGWEALYKQVDAMFSGASRYYKPDMTIGEMAARYTATDRDAWAANVAAELGVSVNTKLNQL